MNEDKIFFITQLKGNKKYLFTKIGDHKVTQGKTFNTLLTMVITVSTLLN